jgi:hypothetical protein
MVEEMSGLAALQSELVEEYGTQSIKVSVENHNHLTVTFMNSELDDLPKSTRSEKAREIALFIRDHYRGYDKLSEIDVVFARGGRRGPVTYTRSQAPFTFKRSDLDSTMSRSSS